MYGLFADFTSDGKLAVLSGERFGGDGYLSPTYTHVYSVEMGRSEILKFEELLFEIDGWYPQWSPDEEKIVLVVENNIGVVDKDGRNLQVLTEGLFTEDVRLTSPVWQPVWND
jgi:Tol biopolymer transport system component